MPDFRGNHTKRSRISGSFGEALTDIYNIESYSINRDKYLLFHDYTTQSDLKMMNYIFIE